jgi:hypothetical protein
MCKYAKKLDPESEAASVRKERGHWSKSPSPFTNQLVGYAISTCKKWHMALSFQPIRLACALIFKYRMGRSNLNACTRSICICTYILETSIVYINMNVKKIIQVAQWRTYNEKDYWSNTLIMYKILKQGIIYTRKIVRSVLRVTFDGSRFEPHCRLSKSPLGKQGHHRSTK